MQDFRAALSVHHFHQLPAFKLSCQISCNSPNFCHPLKSVCGGRNRSKGRHTPKPCMCQMWISAQLLLSEQILCLLTANLQGLGFSTPVVSRRCDLDWLLRGKKLQHPDREIQDFCYQTWCKWGTFCLCCMRKENEILDIKALCHWSSVKWVGLWAHPKKKVS